MPKCCASTPPRSDCTNKILSLTNMRLAEYERGEPGEELIQMAQVFDRAAEKHADERRKHEDVEASAP